VHDCLGGYAENSSFPVHWLGDCCNADHVTLEMCVTLGLHMPITNAKTEVELGVELVVEHRLQLITPAMTIFGNRTGEAAGSSANAQQMRIGTIEYDIRECNRLAAQPPVSHTRITIDADAK